MSKSVNCSIPSGTAATSHVISNLNESGILPGWTCSFSSCFYIDTHDGEELFYNTPTGSCTFESPKGEQKIIIMFIPEIPCVCIPTLSRLQAESLAPDMTCMHANLCLRMSSADFPQL